MNESVSVELVNATGHIFLAAMWGCEAFLAAIVFVWYLWSNRPWEAFFMRFQLAFALFAVAFGDMWAGLIGTLFWFNASQGVTSFQHWMLFALIPIRALATLGFLIAIRAVTFHKYGNTIWMAWLFVNMALGVVLLRVLW